MVIDLGAKRTANVIVRDGQSLHEVMITNASKPLILSDVKMKWQSTADLLQKVLCVSAVLVMHITQKHMQVFLRSSNAEDPYKEGTNYRLGSGQYCESVIGTDNKLLVENAAQDKVWQNNPDMEFNMGNYYGIPLHWPDGSFFGTLCVLDPHEMLNVKKYEPIINEFGSAMEKDLSIMCLVEELSAKNKQAESELLSSRHLYEAAINTVHIAVWEYNPYSHHISMAKDGFTRKLCEQIGIPLEISSPDELVKYIEESSRPAFLDMYHEIDNGAANAECVVSFIFGDPPQQHYERIVCTSVYDKDGRLITVYGLGQDITVQKLQQNAYRKAYESPNSLGSFRHNLTKNTTWDGVSPYKHVLKQQETGTVDGYIESLYESIDDDVVRTNFMSQISRNQLIKLFYEGHTQITFDYPVRHPDGAVIWARGILNMFQNSETGDIEAVTHAINVTDEITNRQIIERVTGDVFDYIGLIYVNTGTFEFLAKNSKTLFPELHKKTDYINCCEYVKANFINEKEKEDFINAVSLKNVLDGLKQNGHHVSTYYRTENNRTLCKQLNYIWLDKKSEIIIVIRSDVTASYERNEHQMKEIEEAKLAAERANEAKSSFLSSVSHDLRTPLNGIIGFTDIALRTEDSQKKQDFIRKIKSSAGLLLDLVNDTLEMSRIESGKMQYEPEATASAEICEDVVTALRPSAVMKNITIEEDYSAFRDKVFWTDKLKLQKIALNILSNAIKYTPSGGKIKLSVKYIDTSQDGCNYVLVVEDNGIGMSKDFLPKLFEPFAQEKRPEAENVAGTGLGLAIIKKIVDMMHGQISVQSEVGRGSKFIVKMPLREIQENITKVRKDEIDGRSMLKGKRVLLCEDNIMNAEIATILLQENEIEVDCAENGMIGLDKFASTKQGYYDAILMDIRMPVMDGYTTTQKIRELKRPDAKTVPIIAMSAEAFEEDIKKAELLGMNGYVTKPINTTKLLQELCRAVLKNKTTMN